MTSKLDSGYRKMLGTPAALDGPNKDIIDSLEKRIGSHVGEAHRLKYARNSYLAISRLQAELLSEVFLYLVRSGVRGRNTHFARGTFRFLQVCKRWNEVAVGCPRIWTLWVAGAVKAWRLFKSRSKAAPLSLTWRYCLPDSAGDTLMDLMDCTIPRRTRHLDFNGTSDQLARFLGAFDSGPPSNVSSIRLQLVFYDGLEPQEKFARLLSSPFPKLSKLNIGNFLPSHSSPIFTTSKLTSLKLFLPYDGGKGRYTLAQFAQILRHHPTLQELDLNHGAIPLSGTPGPPVPFVLPQLVNLRLFGSGESVVGLMDLIGMSSPLHDVVIHFENTLAFTIPVLANTMEKIVAPYYNCQGLDYPRKIETLTISSDPDKSHLTFDARSRSTPTSNLEIKFGWIDDLEHDEVVAETFGLLPSNDVQEFAVDWLPLTRRMLQGMRKLSHLRLCNQSRQFIKQGLVALSLGNQDDPQQHSAPRLESLLLSLSYYETSYNWDQLFGALKERRDHNISLRELVLRPCLTGEDEGVSKIRELVEVRWEARAGLVLDEETAFQLIWEYSDPERSYDSGDDGDVCEKYYEHTFFG